MRVVWSVPAADIPEINDLELIQWEDGTWSVRVETIYEFRERDHEAAYYRSLLDAFTKWMEGQGRPTDEPVDLYPILSKGTVRFGSIEKTYAFFNRMIGGAS